MPGTKTLAKVRQTERKSRARFHNRRYAVGGWICLLPAAFFARGLCLAFSAGASALLSAWAFLAG